MTFHTNIFSGLTGSAAASTGLSQHEMILLPLIGLWLLSEFLIWFFTSSPHARAANQRSGDKGSYLVLMLGFALSVALCMALKTITPWMLPDAFFWIGLVCMVGGIALRSTAVWTLKKAFSLSVTIRSGQSIIQNGPYHLLRHPAYTGTILSLLGFAFAMRPTLAPLAVLLICAAIYGYRITIEERLLLQQFGEEYRQYSGKTWRLIPWVW